MEIRNQEAEKRVSKSRGHISAYGPNLIIWFKKSTPDV
jgi:hypothetical protein